MTGKILIRPVQALSVCLLLLFCSHAALYAQRDTNFVRSYYRNVVPRIVYTYTTQDFFFNSHSGGITTSTSFHTGNQLSLGGEASYKWVDISYSFSLTPDQSKHNTTGRLSTSYRPLKFEFSYALLRNLDYAVTSVKSNSKIDTLLSERENNITIFTGKIKVDYVFNYRKYAYSAGFTQGGRQLKNAGSVIASVAVGNDNFALNDLDGPARTLFDSLNGFTKTNINELDAGVGYGYNWVLGKYWTAAAVDIPNIEYQVINGQTVNPGAYYSAIGFVNHFKGGIMYTRNRCTIGLYAYNMASTSKMKRSNYSNVNNSVDLYVGWVIDTRRRKLLYFF